MAKFYLIINQDRLHVYKLDGSGLESESFEGEQYFPYYKNQVKEAVENLESALLDNNNLENKSDLSFIVFQSADEALNKAFKRALGQSVLEFINIYALVEKAMNKLERDADKYIDELGVNYDGKCYRFRHRELESEDFSLLAYNLKPEDLLKEYEYAQREGR